MIFSDSPSQKALERMMTQVKGFPPRGSGVMVLRRFEYTAERRRRPQQDLHQRLPIKEGHDQ